jgi:protein-tyrosine-phosphatase
MAAGLLRHLWEKSGRPGDSLEVLSAGTFAVADLAATENAVLATQELGIDIASHRSRQVDAELLRSADLVLAVTRRHTEHLQMIAPDVSDRIYSLGEFAGAEDEEFSDPFGGPLEAYRETVRRLETALRAVVERLKREEGPA